VVASENMCLSVPGRVVDTFRENELAMGKVDFGGVVKRVCLEHVPEATNGDWVLVHVGFALTRIDEAEARKIFELLSEMGGLDELSEPAEANEGTA
jgi:hydrogenase expression/formation protein HypC